jgi:protein ImuB
MPYACIYVPNFPVAAVLRSEPELRSRPVAVLEGKPPLEKIIALNAKAANLGIVPGMTKTQAELCAEIALRSRSALQETATHAALLDCAQSFSPRVEDSACDTVLIDLAGMESLFGSLPEIARSLHRRATALGLDATVAVASNADAAMLAARGFSGVTIIPSGQEADRLGSLPVEVLFTGEEKESEEKANPLLETLHRWGVHHLRGLAELPEIALIERLGQESLRLQRLARGGTSRTLVPVEVPLLFEEAVELEHPILLLEPLAFLLNRLLEQLCARLGSRTLATQELRLKLDLDCFAGRDDESENCGIPSESDMCSMRGQPPFRQAQGRHSAVRESETSPNRRQTQFCRTLRLPLPMLDAKLFLKLLQLDLNAHPPGAPIVKIHLSAEPARPRTAQGGLFLPPSPEPEKLELTLARIAAMVGKDRVGALELLDTHHPEGFRIQRFVSDLPRESQRGKPSQFFKEKLFPEKKLEKQSNEEKSAVTALRRFRPPLRAAVSLDNGQPARVLCAKAKEVSGNVLWKAGPWRSSGDWWEHTAWSRDEWDIALQNANAIALYRLVHDLLGGGWFVEGTYD